MKILIFCLLLIVSIPANSQKRNLYFSAENVGIRITDKKIIQGKCYEPGERIEQIFPDSTTHLLYVWLRDLSPNGEFLERKGEFLVIDPTTQTELWRKEFDYLQEHIKSFPKHLLFVRKNKSTLFDKYTGKEIWEKKIVPFTTHYDSHYMLGLKGLNTLVRINIPNGEITWQRQIKHKFGWNSECAINDSIYLIYADALHLIHLNDGTGPSYKIKTGIYDHKGIAYGIVLSIFSIGTAIPLLINPINTASNAIYQDSVIYLAGRKEIACLDSKTLQPIWKNDLNGRILTFSDLFTLGDHLYLLNKGYNHSTPYFNASTQTGISFLASFDRHTGKTISLHELSGKIVDAFHLNEDTLCLWDSQGIYSYSISYDLPPNYFSWDIKKHGKIRDKVYNSLYWSNFSQSHAFPIPQGTDHGILYTDQGIPYEIDGQLHIIHKYALLDVYSRSFEWNNYTFIQGYTNHFITSGSYLLDQEGKKVGSFRVKSPVCCRRDTLYAVDGEAQKVIILNLPEYFDPSDTKSGTPTEEQNLSNPNLSRKKNQNDF